jgi:hypothetical protein
MNIHYHENFRSSVKLTFANTVTFCGVSVGDNVLYFGKYVDLVWFYIPRNGFTAWSAAYVFL